MDENDRREFEKVVSVYKTLKVNADLNEIAKEWYKDESEGGSTYHIGVPDQRGLAPFILLIHATRKICEGPDGFVVAQSLSEAAGRILRQTLEETAL